MSDDLKPEVLKTTQTLLSKFIKKPPLTDKLLKKPPFRYLQDIVTSIIKETGFLKGLYTSEELTVDNNLDKAGKIAFLDKLISAVQLSTGANLSVKSSKIVSGLEVPKTHELLQVIGQALENKIDSKNAVEETLNKGVKKSAKDSKRAKPKEESSKKKSSAGKSKKEDSENSPRSLKDNDIKSEVSPTSSSKENVHHNEQVPQEGNDVKEEDKGTVDQTAKSENSEPKPVEAQPSVAVASPRNTAPSPKTSPREGADHKASPRGEKKKSPRDERKSTPKDEKSVSQEKNTLREEAKTPRGEKKTSPPDKGKGGERPSKPSIETMKKPDSGGKTAGKSPKHDPGAGKPSAGKEKKEEKKEEKGGRKDSRPSSARPGSRKPLRPTTGAGATVAHSPGKPLPSPGGPMKRPGSAMKRPPSAGPRPPSARPGAPRVKERGEVMGEEIGGGAVVGGVHLIREAGKQEDEEEMVMVESEEVENQRKQSLTLGEDQEQQGQLVNQILETQKEFEDGIEPDVLRRTQIEWEGARKKGREAMGKEIEKLKDWIQTVTKCAHPLGKLMGFFQEDVEEMQRELSVWKTKSGELRKQLDIETEKTVQSIEPLKLQLDELESRIVEEAEQVSLLKMKIYNNDQRIGHLLKTNSRGTSGR